MDELIKRLIEAAEGFDACRDIENSNLCLDTVEALRAAQEREKALVEAMTGILNKYVDLVNCGDCGFWDPETEPEVIAARAAIPSPLATLRGNPLEPGQSDVPGA